MTSDIGSTQPPSQPAAAPPTKPNPFARIGGVLFAPSETFKEIAAKPDFAVALSILLIVGFICTLLISPRVDFESAIREGMASQSNEMSKEDAERAVKLMSSVTKALMYFSPVISLILFALIAGVLLLTFRMFGGEGGFKQAFSVTVYGWFPQLIKGILLTIVIIGKKEVPAEQLDSVLLSNLGFLADAKESPVLHSLLATIDVFNIWTAALFTFGFSYVSRMSKAASAAIVLGWWFVITVIKLGFAALGASRMKKA